MQEFVASPSVAIVAIGVIVLVLLVSRGVVSPRAFDAAPSRRGALTLLDPLVAVVLFFVAVTALSPLLSHEGEGGGGVPWQALPTLFVLSLALGYVYERTGWLWAPILVHALFNATNIAVGTLQSGASGSGGDARTLLWRMLVTQAALLCPIVYTLARGALAMERGLTGLGLGRWPGRWVLRTVGAVFLAALPLTFAAGQIAGWVGTLFDIRPPAIAHELLEALVGGRWGPSEVALAAGAVVAAPLFEEILFRGLLQTSLVHSGAFPGRWAAIVVSSFVFVGIHIGPSTFAASSDRPEPPRPKVVRGASGDSASPRRPAGATAPFASAILRRSSAIADRGGPHASAVGAEGLRRRARSR